MNIEFTPGLLLCHGFCGGARRHQPDLIETAGQHLAQNKSGFIWKFLNVRVIVSYGLLFLSLAAESGGAHLRACVGAALHYGHQFYLDLPVQCHLFARAAQQTEDFGRYHHLGPYFHLPAVKDSEKAKEPVDNWLLSGIMEVPGRSR